jgi:hypothetical protein
MKLKELLSDDDGHIFNMEQSVRIFSSPTQEWCVLSVYRDGKGEICIDIEEK